MLRKPILALTKNRNQLAQINTICGNPEDWFSSEIFVQYGLYSTSFDFFVNWENETICNEVWIKRISDTNSIYQQNTTQLLHEISKCDGKEESNRLYRFFKKQNIIEKYMLFVDINENEWENEGGYIVELDLSNKDTNKITYYNVEEIQDKIKNLRKKPASIGKAGLIYSTSSLEGYLSKQQFFWPGDVDTLLYDSNNEVVAIIEFKKHTKNSKIPFNEQKLSNYLSRDILKYKSLALLRDRFKTNLFVIYYPIPEDINYIIIEKLEGSPHSLLVSERYELKLPNKQYKNTMEDFAKRFITKILKQIT